MRMRKKKHGAERIEACSHLLIVPDEAFFADPESAFAVRRPLHLEIGCGKGSFAVGMSAMHPEINLIAMEKISDVACIALERAEAAREERCDNLRFIIGDAKNLTEYFPPHSLERIYLNFSDPWPKSGHAKRRLTHRGFLELYRGLLVEGGELRIKTDNEGLFEFTLEELEALGLEILWMTRDLHASEKMEGNVMTEYERSFSEKGQPIFSVHARFPAMASDNGGEDRA